MRKLALLISLLTLVQLAITVWGEIKELSWQDDDVEPVE